MTKNITNHAAAAAAIRKQIKAHGIAGTVRSESYSGGSSVRVNLEGVAPWVFAQVEGFAGQYQYGNFDGMTDSYNYDNRRDDLPQVRFVFVNNNFSDEQRQSAWDYLRANFTAYHCAPVDAREAARFYDETACQYGDSALWQVLSGEMDRRTQTIKFWKKPVVRLAYAA